MLLDLLGTRAAWPDGLRPGYFPDFGLALLKAGLALDEGTGKKVFQIFTSIAVESIAKSRDDLHVVNGYACEELTPMYIITLDLTPDKYDELLHTVEPAAIRDDSVGVNRDALQDSLCRDRHTNGTGDGDAPLDHGCGRNFGQGLHKRERELLSVLVREVLLTRLLETQRKPKSSEPVPARIQNRRISL
jgi:hypothetical protein